MGLSLLSCDTLSLGEWLSYCHHLQGWSSPKLRHSNHKIIQQTLKSKHNYIIIIIIIIIILYIYIYIYIYITLLCVIFSCIPKRRQINMKILNSVLFIAVHLYTNWSITLSSLLYYNDTLVQLIQFWYLFVLQVTMLQAIERYMKQAIVDRNCAVSSAALVSSLHLTKIAGDVVKRWVNEAQEAVNSDRYQFDILVWLLQIEVTVGRYCLRPVCYWRFGIVEQESECARSVIYVCILIVLWMNSW